MARLIRLDRTGHTELAHWSPEDSSAFQAAAAAFRTELDRGYFAVVTGVDGSGDTAQVRELPLDAELVILRRPIAGG